ncbi:MAG: hypothetical protein WA261_12145 [Candidatus Sulfotelmatobacter sp.]
MVSADSASSAPATTRSSVTPVAVTPENADIVVDPASLLPDLPTLPPTKASLIGGTIQRVDRVRDELTVRVFGGGKMKVFFDTRTHIYNGNALGATPDLRVGDRVYLDTILDAGNIFARNIRLATQTAGGKSQGVVISYQSGKNELLLRDLLSPEAVKLRLTPNTQVVQDGHAAYANQLVPGTLVDVDFISQKDDRDAQKISILAVPGTDFTFAGVVTSLDLHIGLLVLTSQTDRKTYEIYLDPAAITVDDGLHAGANVTTVARFDGSRYVARTLTVNSH